MKIDKEEINKREQTEEEEWNSVKRWKKLMQKQTKKNPITIEKKTETEIKEGQRKELKWVRSW